MLETFAGTSLIFQKGSRVSIMNAAKTLFMLKVFGDGGMYKVIHFIEHPHGRVDNGICTDGPCSFSQTQPQIQQRTGMQGVEHQLWPDSSPQCPKMA